MAAHWACRWAVSVQAAGNPVRSRRTFKRLMSRAISSHTPPTSNLIRWYYVGGEVRLPNSKQYAGDMTGSGD